MRVQARVSEGGHDVAEAIIVQRYNMGLSYNKSKVLYSTEEIFINATHEPNGTAEKKLEAIKYRVAARKK